MITLLFMTCLAKNLTQCDYTVVDRGFRTEGVCMTTGYLMGKQWAQEHPDLALLGIMCTSQPELYVGTET